MSILFDLLLKDTSTALSLIQMLKGMAESGLTILTTIHQPSSQMWSLFDNLLVCVTSHKIIQVIRSYKS
jgi:ABC-type multidrug transport system ATPase subunit